MEKRKLTVFLGAPSKKDLLATDLLEPDDLLRWSMPSSDMPRWRILHTHPKRLKTGFTQNCRSSTSESVANDPNSAEASFEEGEEGKQEDSRLDTSADTASRTYDDDSLNTTAAASASASFSSNDSQRLAIPPLVSLTDLEDLPDARRVSSAPTNHYSISSLVAVLSVSEPRRVRTRFLKQMEVMDLVVGDPTRTGFRISIWLEPSPLSIAAKEMKAIARDLRVMDVVAVQNIALSVFENGVVGCTSRRRGAHSTISVVHRLNCVGAEETKRWKRRWREDDIAERKVARIVKWTREFVDPSGPERKAVDESLPQDTPLLESYCI